MTPLAWLLGLVLPACGAPGAQGLPQPTLLDLNRIERPATPNTALAAPSGFNPAPDVETRLYPVSADRLYDVVRAVARDEPRTYLAREFPAERQAHYVVRSAAFNFPDLVTVGTLPAPAGSGTLAQPERDQANGRLNDADRVSTASALIVWSRSVYGRSDLGVNRTRVRHWLEALDRRLPVP